MPPTCALERIDCRLLVITIKGTGTDVAKIRKSAEELKQMALDEIRAYRGCEDVADVGIYRIIDDRADCNWSISVLSLGSADGDQAHRAAIEVQDKLSSKYDLLTG